MANMIDVDQFYDEVKDCVYKGEKYHVRNNGAIMRLTPEGKKARKLDGKWTFGESIDKGYACFCGERVHRIVATAFLGEAPSKQHVVDHIDANRQNNRPENLRWLTKLENILQNPITKAKIEFRCGSVESFLENPSQLNGYENEDPNFAWMRAVSPEEAKNTLDNWNRFLSHPRPRSEYNGDVISEWLFEQNKGLDNTEVYTVKEPAFLIRKYENVKEITVQEIEKQRALPKKQKAESIVVPKKEAIAALQKVCEDKGWEYQKYFKTDKWQCDVLVTNSDGKRFAFLTAGSETQAIRMAAGIEVCGLDYYVFILKSTTRNNAGRFSRYQTLNIEADGLYVKVMDEKMSLAVFIDAIVTERLTVEDTLVATGMRVGLVPNQCYKCGGQYHVYLVNNLVDANGEIVHGQDEPDLDEFSPTVVKPVLKYVKVHPELGIKLGEIKERMSHTVGEEYMSFGCPHCDAIMGQWYLHELKIEYAYDEPTDCVVVPLPEPITLKQKHWVKKELQH